MNFPILFLTVSSTVTSNLAATARQKAFPILSEDIATAAASRRHSWSQRNFDRRTELERIMAKSSQALEVVVDAATILGYYSALEFDVVGVERLRCELPHESLLAAFTLLLCLGFAIVGGSCENDLLIHILDQAGELTVVERLSVDANYGNVTARRLRSPAGESWRLRISIKEQFQDARIGLIVALVAERSPLQWHA